MIMEDSNDTKIDASMYKEKGYESEQEKSNVTLDNNFDDGLHSLVLARNVVDQDKRESKVNEDDRNSLIYKFEDLKTDQNATIMQNKFCQQNCVIPDIPKETLQPIKKKKVLKREVSCVQGLPMSPGDKEQPKRKREVKEQVRTLPKKIYTRSGFFVEEEIIDEIGSTLTQGLDPMAEFLHPTELNSPKEIVIRSGILVEEVIDEIDSTLILD